MALPEPARRELDPIPTHQRVAILDAGAQYGKVIDRRIRSLNVLSEILPMDTPADQLAGYEAIVISGGPQSVYAEDAPAYDPRIFELGKSVLGICYGMQLMNHARGGKVGQHGRREDGPCQIGINSTSPLFYGLAADQDVLMSHGDSVLELAPGFQAVADSNGIIAAIQDPDRKQYGVQFHPEVDLTKEGIAILRNFLFNIAGLTGDYTMVDRETEAIKYIREKVGDREVLVLVSGGVDSTVCAALLAKALPGERIHAIHVDNGLMRQGESDQVRAALEAQGIKLTVINAQARFLNATTIIDGVETPPLREVTSPEMKRKIIGDTFMHVADEAIRDLGLDPENTVVAQGTLRPDLIESASSLASGKADVIKTHHNDTALVRELRAKGRIVEPLQELHKDEVRELGTMLGLPDSVVWRQPFPGPGLGVRVICAEKPYQQSDFVEVNEILYFLTHYDEAPPYVTNRVARFLGADQQGETAQQRLKDFEQRLRTLRGVDATLLPIRTVGVQGDGRSYSYLAGLYGEQNWEDLSFLAQFIPKLFRNVNRVAYIFGDSLDTPPIDITPTTLTPDVIGQLQHADAIVNDVLTKYDLLRTLSQVPVVLFPVNFGQKGARSIAIRTFITNDFMTGVPARPGVEMPEAALYEMVERILAEVPGIARVVYDLTSKPPGTTEWE